MSKIIFLGTAGDVSVYGRQLRASGGIVLQVEDLQFHFDPGPGALVKAKEFGVNLRATTAILSSHQDLLFCNDINAVIEAMTLAGLDRKGVVLGSKSVLTQYLTPFHQSLVERVILLPKGQKVGIEVVEVHAVSVKANDDNAIGFKLYCPRFTLSYIAETKYSKLLAEELAGTDILILSVPIPDNKANNSSLLDKVGAIRLIQRVQPRLVILTNFGLEMLKADPIMIARDVQRMTGVQTIAAKDGLVLNPYAYSAKSQQYRLAKFYK
ncbi:MAG: hypothetical protein CMH61_01275 [Nanoarchaeota archaeon]|nr:hypothetical protein [Nanoarchaeota archaeon]